MPLDIFSSDLNPIRHLTQKGTPGATVNKQNSEVTDTGHNKERVNSGCLQWEAAQRG